MGAALRAPFLTCRAPSLPVMVFLSAMGWFAWQNKKYCAVAGGDISRVGLISGQHEITATSTGGKLECKLHRQTLALLQKGLPS